MRVAKAFFAFWYDFIVGDDWRIAAGVVILIVLGAGAAAAQLPEALIVVAMAALVIGLTFTSIVQEARGRGPAG